VSKETNLRNSIIIITSIRFFNILQVTNSEFMIQCYIKEWIWVCLLNEKLICTPLNKTFTKWPSCSRDGSSLKSSSPSRARALVKKPGHFRAFDLFTSSLKLGSSFCRDLHARIINFGFETEKSSIELWAYLLRAWKKFEPRLGPTSTKIIELELWKKLRFWISTKKRLDQALSLLLRA